MSHVESVKTPHGDFLLETTALGIRSLRLPGSFKVDTLPVLSRSDRDAKKHAAAAKKELLAYLRGELVTFETPIDFTGATRFQKDVLFTLRSVPPGITVTYGELARLSGYPNAVRAVGGAMKRNKTPIFVPCHRVIAAGSKLGGWSGAPGWKEKLLALEGVVLKDR
jgi:methylated-DNA-[protein]-cysteine S-methyltransferase